MQVDVPVEWTFTVDEGTSNPCNNQIFASEFGIEQDLKVGDNVIEFTPTRTGTFFYSCWMGMVFSTITVVGEDGTVPDTANDDTTVDEPIPTGYTILRLQKLVVMHNL